MKTFATILTEVQDFIFASVATPFFMILEVVLWDVSLIYPPAKPLI